VSHDHIGSSGSSRPRGRYIDHDQWMRTRPCMYQCAFKPCDHGEKVGL